MDYLGLFIPVFGSREETLQEENCQKGTVYLSNRRIIYRTLGPRQVTDITVSEEGKQADSISFILCGGYTRTQIVLVHSI